MRIRPLIVAFPILAVSLAQPAPAVVHATVTGPVARRGDPNYKPLDEDQYDIPAFLRRGQSRGE